MLLTQLPRLAITLVPLVLLLLGFFLPFVFGIIALALFLLFTTWLAYLSWPRTDVRARLIRVAMFVLVVALLATRIARR
jgi:hypothetical protein